MIKCVNYMYIPEIGRRYVLRFAEVINGKATSLRRRVAHYARARARARARAKARG